MRNNQDVVFTDYSETSPSIERSWLLFAETTGITSLCGRAAGGPIKGGVP
jgi:hypothetical protein